MTFGILVIVVAATLFTFAVIDSDVNTTEVFEDKEI